MCIRDRLLHLSTALGYSNLVTTINTDYQIIAFTKRNCCTVVVWFAINTLNKSCRNINTITSQCDVDVPKTDVRSEVGFNQFPWKRTIRADYIRGRHMPAWSALCHCNNKQYNVIITKQIYDTSVNNNLQFWTWPLKLTIEIREADKKLFALAWKKNNM